MGKLLSLSIDLGKIDKTLIKESNGKKYLNLTVSINDAKDQFGNDVNSWHSQTKEEREAKTPRKFLGTGKLLYTGVQQVASTPTIQAKQVEDDLPF